MAVTVSTIAKHVGLSRQTVGFILGDRPHLFREETRKRVIAAAEELGYRRNAAAVAMTRGRYNSIGLLQAVVPSLGLVHTNFLAAVMEEARAIKMHLSLGQVDDATLVDETAMPELMNTWAVDGLLISYVAQFPDRLVDILHRYRLPAIWANVKRPFDAVYADDYGGARAATEHLLKLGHRQIAFVQYFDSPHYSAEDRWLGYGDAMRAAGLQPRRLGSTAEIGFTVIDDGHRQRATDIRHWMQAADRPSAVLVDDDESLPLIVHFAELFGIEIGPELAVICMSREPKPVLGRDVTTVRIPTGALGHAAMPLLLKKIAERDLQLPSVVVASTLLNPDASCRPPVG